MPDYCNTTTDLQRVFSRIEEYQAKEIIDGWEVSDAANNVYLKSGTGFVSKLWENESIATGYDNKPDLISNGEGWYYDSTYDRLYVITSGGDSPDNYTYAAGEDWDDYKTAMRDKAQQMVDAYLNNKYITPLIPRTRKTHDSAAYEFPIVRATALYTCYLIVSRVNPNDPNAAALLKEFYNPNPETGEAKGLINQLMDGDMVLQDQISVREVGSWNLYPNASNSVSLSPVISGIYTGAYYRVWRIQIDTDGAPGTATFKISYDGGTNWDVTEKSTRTISNDEQRVSIGSGLYIYWPEATYTSGDYWDVELFPLSDTANNMKIASITAAR